MSELIGIALMGLVAWLTAPFIAGGASAFTTNRSAKAAAERTIESNAAEAAAEERRRAIELAAMEHGKHG